jgi:hypothetical protein
MSLNEDAWYEKYKPVSNHLDPDASWHNGEYGIMFETYGEELDYVISQIDKNTVWTYIDNNEGGLSVVAGYHIVNRIGYFITEVPWESDDLFWVVEDYSEDE